jgi:Pvc16 N-terminal domain
MSQRSHGLNPDYTHRWIARGAACWLTGSDLVAVAGADSAIRLWLWRGSVATYAAVQGVMTAIEGMLNERLPPELRTPPVSGSVALFGSQTFKEANPPNTLALWLYRIGIDPTVPGGYVRALPGSAGGRLPEVPVMLHFLLIAVADSALAENSLMGWGFQQLATTPIIGADRLQAQALALPGQMLDWDDCDEVQVATEELTREELMRIWDTLPMKYSLTVPYVARGLRVALQPDMLQYPPVTDRTIGFGSAR